MPIDTSIYGIQRAPTIDPMATMTGLLQMQGQQQQLQAGRMELAAKQRAIDDDDAVRGALAKWSKGNGKVDWDGAISDLEATGHGPSAFKLRESMIKQRKEQADGIKTSLENTENTLTLAGRLVRGMEAEITEKGVSAADEVFTRTKDYLKTVIGPELASQLGERYEPARVKAALQWEKTAGESLTAQKDLFDQLDKIRDDERAGKKDAPEVADKWTALAAKGFSQAQSPEQWARVSEILEDQGLPTPIRAMFDQTFSPDAVGRAAALGMNPKERADVQGGKETRAETKRHNLATEANAKARLDAEGAVPELTPDAIDGIAHSFAMGQPLPALGMGKQATNLRTQIMNRAAEMYKGMDLPKQQAVYAATKQSLAKMQVQADAVEAFESTALKNLDVFIDAAKKVVDTGSPFLNTNLRTMNEKLFGDPKMAAFNAARRVAIPEFAKILANPGLSGQLSDSARHEVEEIVEKGATLKQLYAVATTLKTDATNRRESYADQMKTMTERITRPPGVGGADASVVELIDNTGKTYKVPEADVERALSEYKARGLRRK